MRVYTKRKGSESPLDSSLDFGSPSGDSAAAVSDTTNLGHSFGRVPMHGQPLAAEAASAAPAIQLKAQPDAGGGGATPVPAPVPDAAAPVATPTGTPTPKSAAPAPTGTPAPAPTPATGVTAENWMTTLPRASRKKGEGITYEFGTRETKTATTQVGEFDREGSEMVKGKDGKKVKQEYVTHAPTLTNEEKGLATALTAEQQAFVDEVVKAREAIDPKTMSLVKYRGKYGWSHSGSTANDATPTSVQGTADPSTPEGKVKQADQWVWEELQHEGNSASINAYDKQMVTWGRGLGAMSGGLNPTMTELFKDAEIAAAFRKVGVSFENNKWLAINTGTGAVEEGNNALAIIMVNPHILAAMVEIGESHKQAVADAQWKGIKEIGTAKVPDYALSWSKELVQLVAHISHWGPAYGWRYASAGYKDSGGDALKIIQHFLTKASGGANKNGAYSVVKTGPETLQNLGRWGGGIGLTTIKDNFTDSSLTTDDIQTSKDYSGAYIISHAVAGKDGKVPCYVKK